MPCEPCHGLGYRLRQLENGGGPPGSETEIDIGFIAQDWRGQHDLYVIPVGSPSLGQIGPHGLPAGTYNTSVYRYIGSGIVREVGVTIIVDRITGLITMWKAARVPAFSGRIVINYARTA